MLILSNLPAIGLYVQLLSVDHPWIGGYEHVKPIPPSVDIRLQLAEAPVVVGDAREQISFSLDPPRPASSLKGSGLLVRLNESKQSKRVEVPVRLPIEFNKTGVLQFSSGDGRFWLDLRVGDARCAEAALVYETLTGDTTEQQIWPVVAQETPIQSAEEFPESSPFRELGEARWWGTDLFLEEYKGGEAIHRLEMGSGGTFLDVSMNAWLVFKDHQWQSIAQIEEAQGLPIARIKKATSHGLELEGWEASSHVCLRLPPTLSTPLKMRSEDFFAQLRVRSEKQISCMMDKQCLILKVGDWVLKTDQRWRILRKEEEKNAYVKGELTGDLFVFDCIETKGAVKNVCGHYFPAVRTQKATMECPVQRRQGPGVHKGRGKNR
ncbi:MAG: hypothetical protein KGJ02_00175 [Verrucomicrobiota bacterium]|nr:hypothetical protein [Verrucomicrobiota bacterium]